MNFKPYQYQQVAIDFIVKNPVSAVFLDMGLGKTVITLTAILMMMAMGEVKKVLVVAPLRVAKNSWPDEILKWEHTKCINFSVVVGTLKQRLAALEKDADIYIINRENLEWLVNNTDMHFDMVVIDELSSFKNFKTKRFKAMMEIRNGVKRIVGLTGTPSSNGLMDLFAEFKVLDFGKRLGRYITQYRDRYFLPDKRSANVVFSYKLQDGAEQRIYDAISDITISMRACDHLDMPELISNRYMVKMSDRERKQYDIMKKEMVLELGGEKVTAANAAALSNKLMQMSNGAVYTDDGYETIHSVKLDALEDIIEAADGKPMLVTYWFKHDLERIKERLDKLGVVYDVIDSTKSIKDWNARKLAVGIIHPASAGHGLNLQQGGSTIVWFGLTWSLELTQQLNCRLFRQGQADGTVVIQHIITEGSIDEQIMDALEKKECTQNSLIEAVKVQLEV